MSSHSPIPLPDEGLLAWVRTPAFPEAILAINRLLALRVAFGGKDFVIQHAQENALIDLNQAVLINTNALPQIAGLTFLANNTASLATPTGLTVSQSRSLLGLATTDTPIFAGIRFASAGGVIAGTGGAITLTAAGSNKDITLTPSGNGQLVLPSDVYLTNASPTFFWSGSSSNLADYPTFAPLSGNNDGALLIRPSGSATESALFLSSSASPDTTGTETFGFGGGFTGVAAGSWSFGSYNRASVSGSNGRPMSFIVQNSTDNRIEAMRLLNTGQLSLLRNIASTSTTTGTLISAGGIGAVGNIVAGGTIQPLVTVVGSLPSATRSGQIAFVTDALVGLATALGLVVAGGGANFSPVYSDGTNWRQG